MKTIEWLLVGTNIVVLLLAVLIFVRQGVYNRRKNEKQADMTLIENSVGNLQQEVERMRGEMKSEQELLRSAVNRSVYENVGNMSSMLSESMKAGTEYQRSQLSDMEAGMQKNLETSANSLNSHLGQFENRLQTSSVETINSLNLMRENIEQRLDNVKLTVEGRLNAIQTDNNKRLDSMRELVDEKLQKTLNERMTESFKLVNDRLEQVYKGLGEMQVLAQGVGDLKKVMSNVKTRGILGEIQLGAIFEEILSPSQYDKNVVTKKGSGKYVEYAVKIPSEDGSVMYLPVDSKFPGETYGLLCDAYENGSAAEITERRKVLLNTLKSEAKDIKDKYIEPPATTEFAIMFLPFEGLYAEAVNQGYVEILQREYHVNIAGPSTMAALLNSLQMGFRTFAIQKRSGEVWQVLGAVKNEFDKFAEALTATQNRLNQANDELERLVGTRTRQMQRKLKNVTVLNDESTRELLEIGDGDKEI